LSLESVAPRVQQNIENARILQAAASLWQSHEDPSKPRVLEMKVWRHSSIRSARFSAHPGSSLKARNPCHSWCFGVYYPLSAELARDQKRAKRSKPASMHGVRREEDRITSPLSNRAQS